LLEKYQTRLPQGQNEKSTKLEGAYTAPLETLVGYGERREENKGDEKTRS